MSPAVDGTNYNFQWRPNDFQECEAQEPPNHRLHKKVMYYAALHSTEQVSKNDVMHSGTFIARTCCNANMHLIACRINLIRDRGIPRCTILPTSAINSMRRMLLELKLKPTPNIIYDKTRLLKLNQEVPQKLSFLNCISFRF